MSKISKDITKEEVLKMEKATDDFILTVEDNTPGVRFNGFKLRDMDTNEVYHEYYPSNVYELDYFADHELNYKFSHKIITTKTIGTTLSLVVGNNVVKDLVLIERHYINDKLAANYSFNFPLFMPNSQNSIEFIYTVPKLADDVLEVIKNKGDVRAKSDTFVFVEGKLVVHRRAKYIYVDDSKI